MKWNEHLTILITKAVSIWPGFRKTLFESVFLGKHFWNFSAKISENLSIISFGNFSRLEKLENMESAALLLF